MKICPSCNNEKELTDFHKRVGSKDGYQYKCISCHKTDSSTPEWKESRRRYNRINSDLRRNRDFQRKYGIELDDYEIMFREQDGRCAVCREAPENDKRLHVDHCHATGKVRGLLCTRCNMAAGQLRENVLIVEALLKYLLQHKGPV